MIRPFVRLAKLYCLQGKWEESETLNWHCLQVKPWHYVALETMVACHVAQQHVRAARIWSSRRLPTPSSRERRIEWVNNALRDASTLLQQKGKQQSSPTNCSDFGRPSDDSGSDDDKDDGNNTVWQ